MQATSSGINVLIPHFSIVWLSECCCINVTGLLVTTLRAVVGEVASMGVAVENTALARLSGLLCSISTTRSAAIG